LPGNRDPRSTVVTAQALIKFAAARGEKPEFLAHLIDRSEQPNAADQRATSGGVVPLTPTELTSERQDLNASARNRGGRPAKYDWEAFYCEIIKRANTVDGLPDRAELTANMKEWCQNEWNAEPPDSLVRDKIAKVYNVLPTKGH